MAHHADEWRDWLRQHGAGLLLFARQWSAMSTDAEDAVQEGFLKFWKSRKQARDELAYLYACVRTAAMDIGRSGRRRGARERDASRPEQSSFQPSMDHAERQASIEAALVQLPGDQREVVVLKIWSGLTFAQIGLALGVSQNTAASRYRYAMARLEADLSEEVARE